MDDQKEVSKGNLIARMGFLSNGSSGVFCRDFERVLKEMGNVTISEWGQVVTFATDQLGFWEAEWLFSPEHRPNTVAQAEIDGWKLVCRVLTEELVKKVPEVRELSEKRQTQILLRHSLERRINYNKTKPLERLFALVFSTISIALYRLGFTSIAQKLYSYSLYPKGTVGRANL